MSRKHLLTPASLCRKITVLIETYAPNYHAGWWNVDPDEPQFSKRFVKELYTLAREGHLPSVRKAVAERKKAKATADRRTDG